MMLRTQIPDSSQRGPSHQRGVVLFIALVFLIVLTVLGVSLFGTTTSEEKMARNYRDVELAEEAAEAALRDAQIRIDGFYVWNSSATATPTPVDPLAFSSACTGGLCVNATQPVDKNVSLTGSPSVALGTCPASGGCDGAGSAITTTGSPTIHDVAGQPRYVIEKIDWTPPGEAISSGAGGTPPKQAYRVTARATGRSATTQVVLQEVYLSGSE